jgi:hypothetical protein
MAKIGAVIVVFAAVAWGVLGVSVGVAVAEVLEPVVEATGRMPAVHMVLRMRTREGEDFGYVNLVGDLRPVEVWIEGPLGEGGRGRARFEKSDRIWCFDGQESVLYYPRLREASRNVGFDLGLFWPVGWLRHLQQVPPDGVEVLAHEAAGGQGRLHLRERGIPMEPLEPAFFGQFDRETEIVWDLETSQLTELRRWVHYRGERRLFAELAFIEYLPSLDGGLFRIELPSDVRWRELSDRPIPADQVGLGPREVAGRIFEASIQRDRETIERYIDSPKLVDWFMAHDLEVVSLGESFRAGDYPGYFVPYEVKVRWAGAFHYTEKHNLALRQDNPERRWRFDGGW